MAIGGGQIRTRSTLAIDREIIRLSNKRRPKIVFIPSASLDSPEYCTQFSDYFGAFLGCKTDALLLVTGRPSAREIEKTIMSSDIVYVGGGNTLFMMRLWRRLGLDKVLTTAYESGIVLAGISAGAICWFDSGHSDSMSFYHPRNWKYINVKGLGLINGVLCPHYNGMTRGVPRRRDFRRMMDRIGGTGIALENNCAIEVVDGALYRVIASKPYPRAYKVQRMGGSVVAQQILKQEQFAPLKPLLAAWRVGSYATSE